MGGRLGGLYKIWLLPLDARVGLLLVLKPRKMGRTLRTVSKAAGRRTRQATGVFQTSLNSTQCPYHTFASPGFLVIHGEAIQTLPPHGADPTSGQGPVTPHSAISRWQNHA